MSRLTTAISSIYLAFALLSGAASGAPAGAGRLLVLSKGDHTLAVVDATSLKVLGKAPVGEDPHEVIASTDGRTAYVSNYGGGAYHTLAVINLAELKALTSIDLGALSGPHGLWFGDGKVWFTAEGAKAIGRYNPATQKVDWILGTGQNRTHMIFVTADLNHVYTTNIASGTVSIIDKVNRPAFGGPPPDASGGPPPGPLPGGRRAMGPSGGDWDETVVPVGRGAEGFDVSPDGRELWAANAGDGTVSIIELATKRVAQTLDAGVRGANRLKFTPDGSRVFISSLGNTGVTVLDAASHKMIKRFDQLQHAAGIQMQPDGSRVYIACTGQNSVAVIDPKSLTIVGKIDAGPEPDGMAWAAAAP